MVRDGKQRVCSVRCPCTDCLSTLVHTAMSDVNERYRQLPAYHPADAANILLRLAIRKGKRYQPWWAKLSAPIAYLFAPIVHLFYKRIGMKRKTDTIFSILYRLHIVSPKGVWVWTKSLVAEGISLMALLRFAAHFYPQRCALKDGKAALTYQETYQKAQDLAQLLYTQYHLRPNMRVAILGRNSLILTLLLPALSRLGVQTVLLNTDMGREQLSNHLRGRQYQLFIYDNDLIENLPPISYQTVTTTELHHLIIYRNYQSKRKRHPSNRARKGDYHPYWWFERELSACGTAPICHVLSPTTRCPPSRDRRLSISECTHRSPFLSWFWTCHAHRFSLDGKGNLLTRTFRCSKDLRDYPA